MSLKLKCPVALFATLLPLLIVAQVKHGATRTGTAGAALQAKLFLPKVNSKPSFMTQSIV